MRKPAPPRDIPPPLELECLKALWRIGDGTVKDVRVVLTENRHLAYTTVMTVLDRLVKRGTVQRKRTGRSFTYTPRVGREAVRTLAVKELVDSFFDGSADQLVNYLATAYTAKRDLSVDEESEPDLVTNSLETELL